MSNNNFISLLHEDNTFSKEEFKKYIYSIIDAYHNLINDQDLKQNTLHELLYCIDCFYYHYNPNDNFELVNFNDIEEFTDDYLYLLKYLIIQLGTNQDVNSKLVSNCLDNRN